jgi:hypothetical protein
MIRAPLLVSTSSKAAVYLLSRSRIRNLTGGVFAGVHEQVADLLGGRFMLRWGAR